MKNILKKFQREDSFVCVHEAGSDSITFTYGKIVGVDEYWAAISTVSPDGKYDGILIMRIDDILYVEQSVDYDSKMSKLMAASGYTEKSENRCSDNVAMWGLETVNTRHIVSSIRLNNSEGENIVGFVEEVGDGTCKVKTISEYGKEDGLCCFEVNSISQICFESKVEQRMMVLME